ncbi:hypothetical protein AVEN_40249-1 [Araneus ventricosus]|uniref:Uncharacterized protein n=1 Tax=Araneus ventricosus TaxID=182803 RepID=A0A4Y2V6R0_ARAVE|nr:hypothetical protein AVEN_40249-1 [Araneus ventricosus]
MWSLFSKIETKRIPTILHRHPLVLNVLHLLNKLASRDFNTLLCWVPSHVGIVGNEKADMAAKLATASTNSSTPLTDFKKYTKLLFYTKWQTQWDTETENKLHAVKPQVQPWSSLMNRKADTLLTRLRVGHSIYPSPSTIRRTSTNVFPVQLQYVSPTHTV